MTQRIEISYKTIIFIFLFLFFLWVVNQIKDILLLLFIAFILMSAFKPAVERLEKYRLPRLWAIIIVYILLILVLVSAGSAIIPIFVREIVRLLGLLPKYFQKAAEIFNLDLRFNASQLAPAGSGVIKFTANIFSNIFNVFTLFVFTFYFLLERNYLNKTMDKITGNKISQKVSQILLQIENKLGFWIRGQFILCFIIGLMTYIGLLFLKIEYALALAILAGILEIVPTIGPVISAIPAVIIALTTSPLLALGTAALYFLIQQFENYIIVPKVMQKATGFSPILIIIALMVGGRLMGVLGAILAVPFLLVVQVILQNLLPKK